EREAALVGRVGRHDAARGGAVPPAGGGHLRLPRAVGAAALHGLDAGRVRGARGRARSDDPHPRPRDAHAGRLGAADVRTHTAGAPRRAWIPLAARLLRAWDLVDPVGRRAGARTW